MPIPERVPEHREAVLLAADQVHEIVVGRSEEYDKVAVIMEHEDGSRLALLGPGQARKLAASLLNTADKIDGVS